MHERLRAIVAFDDFERHHSRYLEEMHIEVLAGRVDMNEARRERFRRVFRALGLRSPRTRPTTVASAYRSGYLTARRATAGAHELPEALHPRARIGIVSNNLLEEQTEKLQYCGLDRFIDALVVSEEAGISKPDPAIFQLALDRLGVPADEAVMVGDSWAADIVGARRAGIRADLVQPAAAAEARSGRRGRGDCCADACRAARGAAARASHTGSGMSADVRIGVDLGGTKIEAHRDRRGGRRDLQTTRRDAEGRLRRHDRCDPAAGRRGGCGCRHQRTRRHRHAGRDLAGNRPGQERQLHLVDWPAAARRSRRERWSARFASRTTPIASRCRRPSTARAQAHALSSA